MRPPVPVSTLSDAAKWMSELSGAPMSEREVLGHAFNFQWAAERVWRVGDTEEMASCERIVCALMPSDVAMRMRQWRIDGYTDRPATREQHLVPLDSYELLELLTFDCFDLTLPRDTDPSGGDESPDYSEIILDSAAVTFPMLRIYARGLGILSDWWKATIGAAGTPESQRKYVPKQKEQEHAILDWLRGNEYDPKRLPEWKHDSPGAKAGARAAMLANRVLFGSDKVFELAWTRLRNAEDIGDAK